MIAFLIYLLKVSACLSIIYLVYLGLFRKTTFFRFNRLYLLGGIVVSFMMPLTELSMLPSPVNQTLESIQLPGIESDYLISEMIAIPINPANYDTLWGIIYCVGAIFSFALFSHSLLWITNLLRKASVEITGGIRIARTDFQYPFSFFGIIFLPHDKTDPLIIAHETTHVIQRHWIDLLIIELTTIVLWFNPVVYLYRRSIVLQHEYLADENVLRQNGEESYLQCLLEQLEINSGLKLINSFYSKSIKQRIIMMTKSRTRSYLRFLVVIPTIGALFLGFSKSESMLHTSTSAIVTYQEGPDTAPVDMTRVTPPMSGFGERMHPTLHKVTFHTGIDFPLPEGENITSPMDGVVVLSGFDDMRGNYLIIKHNNTFSTSYSHLRSISVKKDASVNKGELIGYVGNTGLSIGPHLHYEVIKNGKPVDPVSYIPKTPSR